MISPLVEAAGRENTGRLKVVKLNVDEAPVISERYGIRGIPLLVLFRGGTEAARLVGAVPREQLNQWLAPHLAQSASPV
jgi:thioredoxin-like negative regulator of GroEL